MADEENKPSKSKRNRRLQIGVTPELLEMFEEEMRRTGAKNASTGFRDLLLHRVAIRRRTDDGWALAFRKGDEIIEVEFLDVFPPKGR